MVTRLGCLRGVSTLTAFALAVEIGDWQRLTGRSIGAYLGLVPTKSSSGASRSQGGITKTGNARARGQQANRRLHAPAGSLAGAGRWPYSRPATRTPLAAAGGDGSVWE